VFTLAVALASPYFFDLQANFLGGGKETYLGNPFLWGHLNFDGEHYLAIAKDGYSPGRYFFFPLYPLLVNALSHIGNTSTVSLAVSGLIISHTAFLIALIGLYKLVKLDFSVKIAQLTLVVLVSFPTSFYFLSFYTESLFLCLVVWAFYAARLKKTFLAGLLGALSTATRLVGLVLLPSLFLESASRRKCLILAVVPIGLLAYMLYLTRLTGDPLAFVHGIEAFGQQRSSSPILLPQVFFRYLVRIIPNLNWHYFAGVFVTLLEFIVGSVFTLMSLLSFFRLRLSYSLFLAGTFILPTLSGSFSSLPRYVLVCFPAFILVAMWLVNQRNTTKLIYVLATLILMVVSQSLFWQGFWIS